MRSIRFRKDIMLASVAEAGAIRNTSFCDSYVRYWPSKSSLYDLHDYLGRGQRCRPGVIRTNVGSRRIFNCKLTLFPSSRCNGCILITELLLTGLRRSFPEHRPFFSSCPSLSKTRNKFPSSYLFCHDLIKLGSTSAHAWRTWLGLRRGLLGLEIVKAFVVPRLTDLTENESRKLGLVITLLYPEH